MMWKLFVLTVVLPTMAFADFCDVCGFEVGVDFLWWKPCVSELDLYTTIHTDNSHEVTFNHIHTNWEGGVRAFAGKPDAFCNIDLLTSYTYVNAEATRRTRISGSTDSHLSIRIFHPGFASVYVEGQEQKAKSSWEQIYHEWDLLIAYGCHCGDCHLFVPFTGIAGIYIDQEVEAELVNLESTPPTTLEKAHWGSDYWGIGLRAGANYEYRISDCFRFFTHVSGTILAGKVNSKHDFLYTTTQVQTAEFKDDEGCHLVPGYHLAVGFIYQDCYCDTSYSLRIGYEFLEWRNISNQRVFFGDNLTSEAGLSTSNSIRTVGFHGLRAGLSLQF